jgi:hypothetical protein
VSSWTGSKLPALKNFQGWWEFIFTIVCPAIQVNAKLLSRILDKIRANV